MKAKRQVPDMFNGQLPPEVEEAYTEALIIMQGRCWAYYSVLLNTTVVWTTACETLGTDGAYVYVNPNFLMKLTPAQRAFGLAHEVGHIVLKHAVRGEFYEARGFHSIVKGMQTDWDHKTYNRAADYVINADLVAHDLDPIPNILFDDRFDRDALVDQVYITVMAEQAEQDELQQAAEEMLGAPIEWANDDDSTEGDPAPEKSEAGEDEGDDVGSDADSGPADGEDTTTETSLEEEDGSSSSEANEDSGGEESCPDDGESTEGEDVGSADDKSDAADGEASKGGSGFSQSEHDGHDEHLRPQYDGTPEEQAEAAQEDREEIERKLDDALDSLDDAIRRGEHHLSVSGPMGDSSYLHREGGNASSVNWNAELIEEVTRAGTGGEQSYAPINRRKFVNYGIVSPTEMGTIDRIGCVVDISGSVCRIQLQQFMLELANAIDMLEPASGALIMFTNTEVVDYVEIMTGAELLELEIPKSGCTYMASSITWMEQMGFDCEVTLCFTDGDMNRSDWMLCAEADYIMCLDSQPDYWMQQRIDASGARVIVCCDD